jgi:hypothetical protein
LEKQDDGDKPDWQPMREQLGMNGLKEGAVGE